jgi:hypothetical protein
MDVKAAINFNNSRINIAMAVLAFFLNLLFFLAVYVLLSHGKAYNLKSLPGNI